MILGAHESVAGGLDKVFERCGRDRAHAAQLWTRSSRQWGAKPLDAETIAAFREAHAQFSAPPIPLAAHASYLINLATPNDAMYARSIATLIEECERAELLGVTQVIVHPGAAVGCETSAGIARVAAALKKICAALGKKRVRLLVDITAGQGASVGCSFEQIADMLERANHKRLGVCLDTQHMWAAGIDWTGEKSYAATFKRFDALIGIDKLEAFHLNDSKRPLGSRVDRHDVVGDGLIGLEPFRRLVNDPRFKKIPGYLETPPLPSGEDSYATCLERLRSLIA